MARKRMIDPLFWDNQELGKCSFMERLLFLGLISNADDEGLGHGTPMRIKSIIFQYDDGLRASDVEKGLKKLQALGFIELYEVNGNQYYWVRNFLKHQTINKSSPSKNPKPEDYINWKEAVPEQSEQNCAPLPDYYGSTTGTLPPEVKVEEEREQSGTPPYPPRGKRLRRGEKHRGENLWIIAE